MSTKAKLIAVFAPDVLQKLSSKPLTASQKETIQNLVETIYAKKEDLTELFKDMKVPFTSGEGAKAMATARAAKVERERRIEVRDSVGTKDFDSVTKVSEVDTIDKNSIYVSAVPLATDISKMSYEESEEYAELFVQKIRDANPGLKSFIDRMNEVLLGYFYTVEGNFLLNASFVTKVLTLVVDEVMKVKITAETEEELIKSDYAYMYATIFISLISNYFDVLIRVPEVKLILDPGIYEIESGDLSEETKLEMKAEGEEPQYVEFIVDPNGKFSAQAKGTTRTEFYFNKESLTMNFSLDAAFAMSAFLAKNAKESKPARKVVTF